MTHEYEFISNVFGTALGRLLKYGEATIVHYLGEDTKIGYLVYKTKGEDKLDQLHLEPNDEWLEYNDGETLILYNGEWIVKDF